MTSITVSGGHGKLRFDDEDHSVYASKPVRLSAGDGDNELTLLRGGKVTLGDGDNAVTMMGGGRLHLGSGNDTVTLGQGRYTITERGTATISTPQGEATISGGKATFSTTRFGTTEHSISGDAVLQANGPGQTTLIGGTGNVTMLGGSGTTTMIGGTGQDTMVGGSGQDLFRFDIRSIGGDHVVQDFFSGQDKLFVGRLSFDDLHNAGAITESGGNTYITLDGGATTIEIQGVTGLSATDILRH